MRPVVIVFALLAAVSPASVGAQSADTPAPFYNLRERSFDSVEADDSAVTNLTRIPIGWFGPTNADDVLGGEMWWAVDFAIREANENGGAQGRPFRLVGRWSDNP